MTAWVGIRTTKIKVWRVFSNIETSPIIYFSAMQCETQQPWTKQFPWPCHIVLPHFHISIPFVILIYFILLNSKILCTQFKHQTIVDGIYSVSNESPLLFIIICHYVFSHVFWWTNKIQFAGIYSTNHTTHIPAWTGLNSANQMVWNGAMDGSK